MTTEALAVVCSKAVTSLSAVALNASAATRTSAAIIVETWSLLKVQVRLTQVAASDINLTFEESDDETTWSKITHEDTDQAVTPYNPVAAVTEDVNLTFRLDVSGFRYVRFTVAGTSGGAGDLVTVVTGKARGL